MKIAILTAVLGNFDELTYPVRQDIPADFHCFTDVNFPPITGLSPRLQYRIPKLFGWEMMPGYDTYLWLDGSMSLKLPQSLQWFIEKLGSADVAFFKHPWRKTIKDEVDHIEEYLKKGNKYIVSRYQNGLHKEQYEMIESDPEYLDDTLLTSTVFIYRNTRKVRTLLKTWWYYQSRYYTCDQVVLPYLIKKLHVNINIINENQFKIPYVSLVSHHK